MASESFAVNHMSKLKLQDVISKWLGSQVYDRLVT